MARALARARSRTVILMDEDVMVWQPFWLDRLEADLRSFDDIGIVGTNDCKKPENLVFVPLKDEGHDLIPQNWVPAHVMAFAWDRLQDHVFPDTTIPGVMGMTDVDLCLQAEKASYRVLLDPNVVVYHPTRNHKETRIQEQRPTIEEQKACFERQVDYMVAKWGDFYVSRMKREVKT